MCLSLISDFLASSSTHIISLKPWNYVTIEPKSSQLIESTFLNKLRGELIVYANFALISCKSQAFFVPIMCLGTWWHRPFVLSETCCYYFLLQSQNRDHNFAGFKCSANSAKKHFGQKNCLNRIWLTTKHPPAHDPSSNSSISSSSSRSSSRKVQRDR